MRLLEASSSDYVIFNFNFTEYLRSAASGNDVNRIDNV